MQQVNFGRVHSAVPIHLTSMADLYYNYRRLVFPDFVNEPIAPCLMRYLSCPESFSFPAGRGSSGSDSMAARVFCGFRLGIRRKYRATDLRKRSLYCGSLGKAGGLPIKLLQPKLTFGLVNASMAIECGLETRIMDE